MPVFGSKELLEDVHNRDLCIGCGACVDLCPYFQNHMGKTAMIFPCTLSQGRCYAHCPKTEVDLDEISSGMWGKPYDGSDLGIYREIMTARAGDKIDKGPFQAGGTVSSLMAFALKTGMIDSAVLTDCEGLNPIPRLVTKAEDVMACATSKYMAAPTLSALNRAVKEGYERIGLVGTPCQVTAVAQMRANPLEKADFKDPAALVVGLFCTWALDTRNLAGFLSGRMDIMEIRGMDIPPPPADIFVVETSDGKIEIPLDEIRPLVPHSCRFCPDMTSEWADISVGVLEGKPDWNSLIIRTDRGKALIDRALEAGYITTEAMPDENLEHLAGAAGNKKRQALVRAVEEGLVNRTEEGKRSCIRVNTEVLEKITASGG